MPKVEKILSKSELKVYEFIKQQAEETSTKTISIPISKISEEVNVSHATVQRAINKLQAENIIGILPSQHKKEPNKIIYYGEQQEEKGIDKIKEMTEILIANARMVKNITDLKDKEIERLKLELEQQKEKYQQLLKGKYSDNGLNKSVVIGVNGNVIQGKVLSITDLGDNIYSVIIQKD